jgi:hypothetical protein
MCVKLDFSSLLPVYMVDLGGLLLTQVYCKLLFPYSQVAICGVFSLLQAFSRIPAQL